MIYQLYELQMQALAPARAAATFGQRLLTNPLNPFAYAESSRLVAAALDVFEHSTRPYGKPEFGLATTQVDGVTVDITEEIVLRKPFGQLKHFARDTNRNDPKVLIVAPMSGHYATLLRGTVERMLPGHDVYITDWRDAKLVPMWDGRFDLDDYIDYIREFLDHIGPGAHMIAVCQPSVPAYAATAFMHEECDVCTPASLTMMGGPIDTREGPTEVNQLAMQRPLAWFEHNVVCRVPAYYPGAFRRVYPGFLQLAGFMTMNLGNHMMSHWSMYKHLVEGDGESADSSKAFYEEYRAVCDMAAEFYLQTVETVFQKHLLPKGEFVHRGRLLDPKEITHTALLAVEGERDDISGLGQTKAALKLATKLPDAKKKYHMAPSVGHYGIFNGRKWREQIAPVVIDWIAKHNKPTA
jgi:poly(3-hydroxybutyrate) depolymerase